MRHRSSIVKRCALLLAANLVALMLTATNAAAQSCSFTMPIFDFGDIDLTANTIFDLTANLTATCTGTPGLQIRFCPNIEGGTGGHSSGDPRHMLNGADQLDFNIYGNAALNNIWGSRFWAFSNPPQPRVTLDGTGNGSRTRPVRVRIFAGQTTLPIGLYTTSFSGANTLFAYDYHTGVNCAVIGTANAVQVPFTVQANNTGSCSISANNLNFGTLSVLTANSDASTTVSVTCSNGVTYQVGLNGGLTGAVDPTQRKMASGPNQLTYGLYQDAGRLTPWGETLGIDTVSGTGSGSAQTLSVHGRVPAQTTPPAATYSDTVVVTITY